MALNATYANVTAPITFTTPVAVNLYFLGYFQWDAGTPNDEVRVQFLVDGVAPPEGRASEVAVPPYFRDGTNIYDHRVNVPAGTHTITMRAKTLHATRTAKISNRAAHLQPAIGVGKPGAGHGGGVLLRLRALGGAPPPPAALRGRQSLVTRCRRAYVTGVDLGSADVNHHSKTMEHDSTTVDHDSASVDHDSACVDHHSTTVDHESLTVNHESLTVDFDSTGVDFDSTGVDFDSTGVDFDSTGVDLDSTGVDFRFHGRGLRFHGRGFRFHGRGLRFHGRGSPCPKRRIGFS